MSKRMNQLEIAWQQEADAKANRYIMSKYTRKQRRWLPLFENFGHRHWLEAEKQFRKIAPRAAIKVRRFDAEAWASIVSRRLQEVREGAQ